MGKLTIILCIFLSFAANCSNEVTSTSEDNATSFGGGDPNVSPVQSQVTEEQSSGMNPQAMERVGRPAAYDFDRYVPLLRGKRLGLVVNQTSTVGDQHLVDALLTKGLDVRVIFAPEHGFRGQDDAGATVADGRDTNTGLPITSLYGKNKRPSAVQLRDVDVLVFDIQDVGARFYTYISTLLYVMQSAADNGKEVMVLDRPNPNGLLVDGPILAPAFSSFVGVAPIPVGHGLTVGEFAKMANGEGWLGDGRKANLTVVDMPDYRHDQVYELPIAPSPNLPNQRSIYLYPHLCFFEGTALSVGRGTRNQFQVFGHPSLSYGNIRFTPTPGPGSASPKLQGQLCRGEDLTQLPTATLAGAEVLDLHYLLEAYQDLTSQGITFFTRPDFFDLLAGTDRLRKDIEAGKTEGEIRAGWSEPLASFRRLRERYLLYP